jgi:hypothetical protein
VMGCLHLGSATQGERTERMRPTDRAGFLPRVERQFFEVLRYSRIAVGLKDILCLTKGSIFKA